MEPKFNDAEFEQIRRAEPSAARLDAIRSRVGGSLRPVKPLPSDWILITGLTAGFICLGVACALPIGLKGFHAMNGMQRMADYFAILLCAVFLASALTGEIIPGKRRRVSPAFVTAAVFALTILVTVVLFPDFSTVSFLRRGIPCLAIGTACAIPAAVLVWLVMRLGMLTDTLFGILTAAVLSGLLGVFALALHCPILNAAHILTWHLGVPVLCLGVGVLVARRIDRGITTRARESARL